MPRELQRAYFGFAPECRGVNGELVFSRKLLIGWISGAVAIFAVSLYFMGGGEVAGPDSVGPSTFSRSAIGQAGIAEVLQQLGVTVVKSRANSLDKLSNASVSRDRRAAAQRRNRADHKEFPQGQPHPHGAAEMVR